MVKATNKVSTSELIYYIYIYNPNFEHRDKIIQLIDFRLKNIYHFNDEESKFIKQIEINKLKERDPKSEYLFNQDLSATEKFNIICDLYEKDEISKLTIGELAIATNLMVILLEHYYISKKRAKNEIQLQKSTLNYEYINNITNELADSYNIAIDGDSNYRRFRSMYIKSCLPTDDEKADIKKLIKKQSKS